MSNPMQDGRPNDPIDNTTLHLYSPDSTQHKLSTNWGCCSQGLAGYHGLIQLYLSKFSKMDRILEI